MLLPVSLEDAALARLSRPGAERNRLPPAASILPAALLLAITAIFPATEDVPETEGIRPGPEEISPEEAALAPDPQAGLEHAVILIDETEQVDDLMRAVAGKLVRTPSRTRYHLRAKVLSNEGRGLANVTIPLSSEETILSEWWGFTIHPDGSVRRLVEGELRRQTILHVEDEAEVQVLTALLPAVEPGTVIDYGYELSNVLVTPWRTVPLQRDWPVKRILYRWRPWHLVGIINLAGACSIGQAGGLTIDLSQEAGSFLIRADGLPPVVEEPWMPAADAEGATALLYYTYQANDARDFWDRVARREAEQEKRLLDPKDLGKIRKLMGIGEEMEAVEGLHRAYDWIMENVENLGMRVAEDLASLTGEDEEAGRRRRLLPIVESKRATAGELDLLFLGIARSLGIESHSVLTADRRGRPWDPGIFAMGQFDERLVAVRLPGDPEGQLTLIDAGSGLGFGEIPWWLSGTLGMVVDAEGHEVIRMDGTSSVANVSESEVELELPGEASGTTALHWARRTKGQYGLVERRALRRMNAADRAHRLEALCRGETSMEIVNAEVQGLERASGGLAFDCRGESSGSLESWEDEGIRLSIGGPWIEEVPLFSTGTRRYPVEFPFARTDLTTIRVSAPEGLAVEVPPQPVRIEGPFGAYHLQWEEQGGKWTLQRSLKLLHQRLEPDRVPGLRRFLEQVRQADRKTLLFRRKLGASP